MRLFSLERVSSSLSFARPAKRRETDLAFGRTDTVECSTIKSLPDLTFYFGGKPYTLTAEDYILQVQNQCLSAFTGIDIPGTPLWIIGDVFLRKFYTVYDKGRDAVGFAVSA